MVMIEEMRRANAENMRLKLQLLEEEERFATPEEGTPDKKEDEKRTQVLRKLRNRAGILSEEDGRECQ